MKFVRSFLREFNLVLTTTPEVLNDQNLLEQVQNLNKEATGIFDLKELADCRNLKDVSGLTVEGAVRAGSIENDRPESLFALLIPDDKLIFGFARAFQMFSEEKRKSVEIFTDVEKALDWLNICEEAKAKAREMLYQDA